MTLTVKEEALDALYRARTVLSDDVYTTEAVSYTHLTLPTKA